jgi:hypothetical protein
VADTERLQLIRKLRHQLRRNKDEQIASLIRKLHRCRAMRRCLSSACPVCSRALQRWFVEVGDGIGRGMAQSRSQRPRFLSIVPDFGRVQRDELMNFDIEVFRQRTLEALRQCGITAKLGALDVSLNHWEGNREESYFQFQYWVLIAEASGKSRQRLAAAINASGKVRKPVFQAKRKWPKAALAYGIRSKPTRRESFEDASVTDRNRARCTNTRNRELLGADLAALMVFLDNGGLHQRLLTSPLDPAYETSGVW